MTLTVIASASEAIQTFTAEAVWIASSRCSSQDGKSYRNEPSRACAAALRRHSRHRQSPPSIGIGSRAVSSAHQHAPSGLQVNTVPHAEQAMRCDEGPSVQEDGLSVGFVMKP
jgi:hypothetical protein